MSRGHTSPFVKSILAGASGAALLLSASAAQATPGHIEQAPDITTPLIGADGAPIGDLHVFGGNSGVILYLKAQGLTPGPHGMHIHMVGECDDSTDFESASHAHGNQDMAHGALSDNEGHHEGVLPNLIVHADGTAEVELYSTTMTFKDGPTALLDADGASLVIHENADDHKSEMVGGSGKRIACAVIK